MTPLTHPDHAPIDMEHLLLTLEKAQQVQSRAQFFLWAQGAVQGFVPHASLWCALGDLDRMALRVDTFTRGVPDARVHTAMTDPIDGLLRRLLDDWLRAGRVPRVHSSEQADQMGRRQLITELARCGFDHVLVHGVREPMGEHGTFFVFAGLEALPGSREAYLLELLMPHLHLALHRMHQHEGQAPSVPSAPAVLLSRREIQVLHWVRHGKTNQEIALILGISPPTVKNHLQKIMRKLNVNNRAQAVGKSATLRLLTPAEQA